MRTLVIGDIHGGLKALIQLLDRAKVKESDTLIFVGDYVDGWSESSYTIRFLIDLSKTNNCIFIKGNHDIWCENWLREGTTFDTWLFHGGKETIESYTAISEKEKQEHLSFLEQMKLFHIDDHKRLFVHAGFVSMHGPEREYSETNLYYDRTLWEMALALDKDLDEDSILFPKRLKLFNEIYIGHTPTINFNSYEPMNAQNIWNIDTGAAFYGKLSCMDINTKEVFQSDPVQTFYPDEKGRNR
jgi:serine/threonine protein phosphatase 1